jgi:hypothetical protein
MNPPNIPTFETWSHENLARFAAEAYLKLQDQHELIQHLRQLIANTPEKPSGKSS